MITPEKRFSIDGVMSVGRCVHNSTAQSVIVVGLAGGPGLSSFYIDDLIIEVSKGISAQGIVIDYPLHGEGCFTSDSPKLDYDFLLNDVAKLIKYLSLQYKKIIVVGHSMGARIATDSATIIEKTSKLALISLPYEFKSSDVFLEGLKKLESQLPTISSNRDFEEYFFLIHHLFFANEIHLGREHKLFSKFAFEGTSSALDGTPQIPRSHPQHARVFLGSHDFRLSQSNSSDLAKLFGPENIVMIENAGHFPMIESPVQTVRDILSFLLT
jgi:pimeloyl-ACP methyl ester carboxylesterase